MDWQGPWDPKDSDMTERPSLLVTLSFSQDDQLPNCFSSLRNYLYHCLVYFKTGDMSGVSRKRPFEFVQHSIVPC